MTTIGTGSVAIELGASGWPRAMQVGSRRWELGDDGLGFLLGGEEARAQDVRADGCVRATLWAGAATARLEIAARETLEIDISPSGGRPEVTLEVWFPEGAEFHLPAAFNTGWAFGADMPVGEERRFGLVYQFVLVRLGADVLRLTTRSLGHPPPDAPLPMAGRYALPRVTVRRVAGGFRLRYAWSYGGSLHLERFASLEEATADYARWLEATFEIEPRGHAAHRPDWLWNTRLAFTVDLWRSHGEISHTYQHVIDLMKALRAAGAPPDTLLYLTGWSWRFDGHYPEYRPSPVLGGVAKFQEMVATAHATGYRLMVHLCGPGYDPYLPSFQAMQAAATLSSERTRIPNVWEPQGERGILTWLGGLITPFRYDSGRQGLTHAWDGDTRSVSFDVRGVPDRIEAYLTVGGVPTELRMTINGRSQESTDGGALRPEGYGFPFPFFFQRGNNTVRVEAVAGEVSDWSALWYRIHDAKQMDEVWTYPIAGMNINDPAWRSTLVQEIVSLVQGSGIDAVHLDTHHVGVSLWDWRPALAELRVRLPGLAFGSEVQDEQGLQTFSVTQSSSLWPYIGHLFMPEPEAARQITWQRRSPVSRLVSDRYLRVYPHLGVPAGFVPTGSVVHHDPPALPARDKMEALQQVLAHADELGVIPTLRVNYRDYGLDTATRAFVGARGRGD